METFYEALEEVCASLARINSDAHHRTTCSMKQGFVEFTLPAKNNKIIVEKVIDIYVIKIFLKIYYLYFVKE